MRDIAGMSVLVTGGGSGLGRATAAWLAKGGARVTITGRRADRIAKVAAEIGCAGVAGDVTVAADRARMVAGTVAHGGGLGALVNNAGNMLRGEIETLDETALLALFHTNVVGAMLLTGLAALHLERSRGSVVFVGSVHTRRAFPGASAYAATKGAVEVLARVLAAELGPRGIRVNCVVPGGVATEINVRAGVMGADEAEARQRAMLPMQALDRLGTGEDVAEAIGHLLAAEWTTGATLEVDGGLGLGVTRA